MVQLWTIETNKHEILFPGLQRQISKNILGHNKALLITQEPLLTTNNIIDRSFAETGSLENWAPVLPTVPLPSHGQWMIR